MNMKKVDLDKTFGKKKVESNEREQLIRRVFSKVAPRYDLMNDAMSFGIHRLWKSKLAKLAKPLANQTIIDLAGGTGDIAIKMAHSDRTVFIADPSIEMMESGQERHNIQCIATTGEKLSFADNSVDTITIAFGVRNMTHMKQGLAEMHRVLKPGGRMLCLEFSKPHKWLKPFYDWHSYHIIPRLGAWIAQQPEAYTYLIESIRRFPDQEEMKHIMEKTGFSDVTYYNVSFGIACIHIGIKE
ncbi:MAG TPA: bifunctional demethylmenaquinone methyltransferase/2-methoxy-6-polyprenyl-1,4-benzoquinol methylase UbiE [Leucothrix sp.]|nr:bifunctional demethylmenaquinone methyltransferase/2-methoxy-6-polyprenyl-1,4-benzoquinol methylase UbiE [Leucothrix sp.]